MKNIKKILICILSLVLVLGMLASCKKNPPNNGDVGSEPSAGESDGTTDSGNTPPENNEKPREDVDMLSLVVNGASDYKIVYSQNAEAWELEMAVLFKNTIKNIYGVDIPLEEDYEQEGTEYVRTDKEIVIGQTNREDEYDPDYNAINMGYRVFTDYYRLVITGGSKAGVYKGICKFFADFCEVDISQENYVAPQLASLYVFAPYDELYASLSAELPELQIPLADYTVIYDNGNADQKRAAAFLHTRLGSVIETAPKLGVSGEDGKKIMLTVDTSMEKGTFSFSIAANSTEMVIKAADYLGFDGAAEFLVQTYQTKGYFDFGQGYSKLASFKQYRNELNDSSAYAYDHGGNTRVMFYNILWGEGAGERHPLSLDAIKTYMPDVIGFQEFSNPTVFISGINDLGYGEACPVSGRINYTALYYNTKTTSLVASGAQVYSEQSATGNDAASKSFTWGVFESKIMGGRYIVVSTHLSTQDQSVTGPAQAQEVMGKVNELVATYNCPVILGGDFNSNTAQGTYKEFADNGYTNAKSVADIVSNTKSFHKYPEKNAELGIYQTVEYASKATYESIDHIMVKNNTGDMEVDFNVFGVAVDDRTLSASDHLPLFVDFDVKDQGTWTPRY